MSETDCRCAVCGCCKHDHGGYLHPWESRTIVVDGKCRVCDTPWGYDQPVCVNEYCRTHGWLLDG